MPLGFLNVGKQAGGLDHHVHAQFFPGQLGRIFGADHLDLFAVDDEHIRVRPVGGGLLRPDGAVEAALDGIILQEIREVIRRHNIANGNDFHVFPDQTLLDHRPEHQATNAAEPINCNFDCHNSFSDNM